MARLYTSVTAHINNHPYTVMVSAHYQPNMPEPYVNGELDPIHTEVIPHHFVRSRLPIKYLLDMFITKVPFMVIDDREMVEIFHTLDAYLLEIQESIPHNADIRRYAENVLAFRAVVYQRFVRVLNMHPDWRAAYSQGVDKLLALFEVFAAPDFQRMKIQADPIEQLRQPPINLASLTRHLSEASQLPAQVTNEWSSEAVPYSFRV